MTLRESSVLHNIETMAQYCRDHRVDLAPHGKTTMSPQLFRAQLAAGAWGVTAATGEHVRTYRKFGISRVFLANELVDPATIAYVAKELSTDESFEFICYVDSVRGVDLLDTQLRSADPGGRQIDVVVEMGVPGGRTGCRSIEEGLSIARAAAATSRLQLRGVSGYEGAIGLDRSADTVAAVRTYCGILYDLLKAMTDARLMDGSRTPILSAGGSLVYDLVVETLAGTKIAGGPVRLVLRSGAYVSHDHGLYRDLSPFELEDSLYRFEPALRLWGRVLSRPEPRLAVADFGRRDAPFDQGLPIPLETRQPNGSNSVDASGLAVTALNDQHAFISVPADRRLEPGDWVGCGISHPCTAFDKWRAMAVVDDADIVVGGLDTYF